MSTRTTRVQLDGVEYLIVEWSPAQPTGFASLTPSERAVATLVAGGASNAAIAEARKTSVRTVANQIGAILKKLGVPSRVHVAAMLPGESE